MGQTSFNFNQDDTESVALSVEWFHRYTSVAKMGGYFPNIHGVGRGLFPETSDVERQTIECLPPVAPKEVASLYFEWLIRSDWIGKKQITHQMRDKFFRRMDQARRHWNFPKDFVVSDGYSRTLNKATSFLASEPKAIDLSIIMPTFNVADFILGLLDSMYAQLVDQGFTFEVFVVDDGSTDTTATILRDFANDHKHENFFFMSTLASNGAGKSRNLALPLVEGRYTYFADTDDVYDFAELAKAVDYATKYKKDLIVMPYFTEFVNDDEKQKKLKGMMDSDDRIWTAIRAQPEPTHIGQKEAALGLINYPWKQLTSSKLLFDADVFFGPTKVHNDVQFHWTSIAASENIHFYHKEVCTHRKFDTSVRGQLTEVKDVARMSVFASLGMTQRALANSGHFDGKEGKEIVFPHWRDFSIKLLKWAKKRIPKESGTLFNEKQMHFLNALNSSVTNPSELRKWPYWGERFAVRPMKKITTKTV
jgi:glycosyltransferase involved in cell wall biosynthesis